MSDTLTQSLTDQIARLEHRIGVMEDTQAILNLFNAYGYYQDKLMHEAVLDCFAEDSMLSFRNGLWRGKEGVRRFWCGWLGGSFGHREGPEYGHLLDHCQLQNVIHVADDRKTARMRSRYFSQGSSHETREMVKNFWPSYMEGGIAEDVFVKEDGIWKIQHWHYMTQWQCDYQSGWDKNSWPASRWTELYPDNPIGPDEFIEFKEIWPHTHVVPFHYPHPVTGEKWEPPKD